MSRKKNSKRNETNNFPFLNEIKKAKEGFKQMIDEMSDEEFIDFAFLITLMTEELDDDLEDLDDFDFDGEFLDDSEIPF